MKRLTQEEFIQKAVQVHNAKYDYSKVVYTTNRAKVTIICPKHGEFSQLANNHLGGRGCPSCRIDIHSTKIGEATTDGFISKAVEVHGQKYDYSKVVYTRSKDKITIKCPRHGDFIQTAGLHLKGSGCAKCHFEQNGQKKRMSMSVFLEKAKTKHGNRYGYDQVEYETFKDRVSIVCPEHGFFYQQAQEHLKGSGCPRCKHSKGENTVRNILIEMGISFEEQKRFDGCKLIKPLPFDFYLPDFDCCIEYDGEQHFHPISYGRAATDEMKIANLNRVKESDQIKTNYAKKLGMMLIRIPYWKLKNAEEILMSHLKPKENQ